MDNSQVALKLLMEELAITPEIKTVRERKTVQKAVYLGQAAGVDLGYRYNWYIMGPYSPSLTRDYFALNESLSADDDASGQFELQESVKSRLERIKPLMGPPPGVTLSTPDWLELLASLHYLLVSRRLDWPQAKEYLREKKQHVANFADSARDALKKQDLIPAS